MMRLLFFLFLMAATELSFADSTPTRDTLSPLAHFSSEWNKPEYRINNTAAATDYLTTNEKNVFYILNLARQHPRLFLETVVSRYPEFAGQERLRQSDYFKSLVSFLRQIPPQPILYPDQTLFESARCHAITSGESGYVGHKRRTQACKKIEKFSGECCDYGYDDPLSIVMHLLIDEDVPDLGHRLILFSPYTQMGVSIQPHRKWRWNTVLDLK